MKYYQCSRCGKGLNVANDSKAKNHGWSPHAMWGWICQQCRKKASGR